MARYFTRASKLVGLADVAPDRADLAARMKAAELDPEALRHPEMSIDYGAFCRLMHDCAVAWEMPDIGLRMARRQGVEVLGPVALIVRMERSVRTALVAICENLVIHSNAIVAALEESPSSDTAALVLDIRSDAPSCYENVELILAQARVIVDAVAEKAVPLVEASFRHERGPSARAVAAHFGCPIRYGSDRISISFDRAILDRPLTRTDLAYHGIIKRYLTTARAEVAESLVDEAMREVGRQMEVGTCSLENVARSLKVSPRSLQRQLKDDGTTFGDLVDRWRRERALALVTHTRLPLSEVSEALGYSEQSVFTKAFRRWYGGTPLRCRAEGAPPVAVQ